MKNSTFIRLPKKSKAVECTEFRTLSLMSHMLKVLLRIILRRNKILLEKEIDVTQSGFIGGKGTREGIFNMRTISERYLQLNKEIYVCFIDYEKAFDRVNHEKLIQSLQRIGVRGRDIRFIRNLYWDQKAFIKLENSLSDEIKIKRGVRQGCVLSPTLFNLYTEMIFREIEDLPGINIGGRNVNNLRYADDTVLVAENEEHLQNLLDTVNNSGLCYGMKMNAKKTKSMVISRKEAKPRIKIKIGQTDIEQVDNFIYLGQMITEDGRSDKEIIRRISIAKGIFNKMSKNVLCKKETSLKTRKRILTCYVWSTLLYGADTWTLNTEMIKRLSAFEMWCYRKMLRISWYDKISNEEVLKWIKEKRTLVTSIKIKKLKLFGHIVRRNNLQRDLMEGHINGKRGRGRPITTWTSNIQEWTGLKYSEAIRAAHDRPLWRAISSNPLQEDGT